MVVTRFNRGVTVVELMVVIAIFALVSSALFFNYSRFSTGVSIRDLAQQIALSVRKAQVYATSVQNISGGASTASYSGYGVSFSLDPGGVSTNPVPNQKQFVLFADIVNGGSGNRLYDNGGSCGLPSSGNECIESYGITTGDTIVQLCTDTMGCVTSGTVNIIFHRPAPDADICIVSGGACFSTQPSYVTVVIQSAAGAQKRISIWNTGQIDVQ